MPFSEVFTTVQWGNHISPYSECSILFTLMYHIYKIVFGVGAPPTFIWHTCFWRTGSCLEIWLLLMSDQNLCWLIRPFGCFSALRMIHWLTKGITYNSETVVKNCQSITIMPCAKECLINVNAVAITVHLETPPLPSPGGWLLSPLENKGCE